MAIVSDVEIRLRADIARLQQDMTAARQSVNSGLSGIQRAAETATKALGAIGVGIGIKEFLSQVVDAQREFDKLNSSLVTATGSTANAAQAFQALQSFAATTPYSVKEATEAFIRLKNLGLDPSEAALRSYGNTASSQSKPLMQFVEAVADATHQQYERLKEFGIDASKNGSMVAFTFKGVTTQLKDNAKDIQAYLKGIGDVNFAGAMERQANTLDGAISNLSDTWDGFLRQVAQNGVGQGAMASVLALSSALNDLGAILDAVGGKANDEGKRVQEAAGLHKFLTTAFEAVAVVGTNVAYILQTIGADLGAFTASFVAFAKGDFAMSASIIEMRKKDAEEARKAVDAKSEAILGAAAKNQAAQDAETANLKKNGTDRLAQYQLELSPLEKQKNALLALTDVRKKLLGLDPQDLADQDKIKTALDTGAISRQEYNTLMAASNKQMQANSLAYKQEQKSLDAQAASIQAAAEARAIQNQRDEEHLQFLNKSGQMTQDDLINAQADAQVKVFQQQISDQQMLLDIAKKRQDSGAAQQKINGDKAKLQAQIDGAQAKRDEDLLLLEQERYKLAVNNTADLIEAAQKESKTQKDTTRDMQDEIDALGMTAEQIAQVTAARLRDQAAALDRRAEISIIQEVTDELHKQADELRKQADLGLTKEKLQEQQKFWGSIESTAHDTFVSIADGGKDAFTRLKESAKNIFFEWLYQMTLKKWIVNIGASVDGSAAVAGIAGSGAASSALGSTASGLGAGAALGGLFGAGGVGGSLAAGAGWVTGSTTFGGAISAGTSLIGTGSLAGAASGLTVLAGAIAPIAIGAVVASAAYKKLFGMGDKQYSDTSTLSGVLGNDTFSGQVGTAYTQKGGWFRSDRSGTDYTAVDSATSATLISTYNAVKTATSSYAQALGLSADSIMNRTDAITVTLGKDADANAQAISDYFTGLSNTIATQVLPNIAQFEQSGEDAATTLQRLATDFTAMDAVLAAMGTNSQAAFGAVGVASLAARERLIALAGGLDSLASETQYYLENFLTAQEKADLIQQQITPQTNVQGLESFKFLVESIAKSGGLASEGGQELYTTLLALAPQFKALDDALKQVKADAQTAASAALDALSKSVDAQKDIITDAYNAAMDTLSGRIDTVNAAIEKTTALSQALRGAMLGIDSPDQMAGSRASAQAEVMAAIAIAKASGVLPTADDLADALNTLRQDPVNQFSTMIEYQRAVAQTNAQLEELGGISDDQLSDAQLQLQALKDQQTQASAQHEEDLARLDAIVSQAQAQLDATNGVNSSVLAIGTALANFSTSLAALAAANAALGINASTTPIVPSAASGVPFVLNVDPGGAFQSSTTDVVYQLQTLNDQMASVETNMTRTANRITQLATQFDQVSAGGNALATEVAA